MGPNPGKARWWTTGRASSPKLLTAPAKSQLTIRDPWRLTTSAVWVALAVDKQLV